MFKPAPAASGHTHLSLEFSIGRPRRRGAECR